MAYNGWKNYETWNASLWINNDEPLYNAARSFMRRYHGRSPYRDFIKHEGMDGDKTPDGVKWGSRLLSQRELNRMMRELIS